MKDISSILWILGSVLAIILFTSKYKLHAFIVLFSISMLLAIATMPLQEVLPLLKEGFGKTAGNLGFLLISGSFIAVILEQTGAAKVMAQWFLSKLGDKQAPLSLGLTGYLGGLLLFCDTGFILFSSLLRGIAQRVSCSMPFLSSVLAISLYSVHCLTPTHPGILGALGIIPVDFGYILLGGSLLSLPGLFFSYQWIKFADKKWGGDAENFIVPPTVEKEEAGKISGVFASFLPVLTPITLLFTASLLTLLNLDKQTGNLSGILSFLGQAPIALGIGAFISIFLLHSRGIPEINKVIDTAIQKTGSILFITAGGGIFGLVIKEMTMDMPLAYWLGSTGMGLFIPFLIASFLKIAQGSSTISVLTTAALISPMLTSLGLDTEAEKIGSILAIGAGSMVFSHANDSYFWVISQFSGLSPKTTLKYFTVASIIMGLSSILALYLFFFIVVR
jgi:GntP family gluconate:H+ symporter